MRAVIGVVAVMIGGASSVHAETDPRAPGTNSGVSGVSAAAVTVEDDVPFVAADLVVALRARVATDVHVGRVAVHALAADVVEIDVDGSTRVVALGGRQGAAAARFVALASIDLFAAEPPPEEPAPTPEPAPPPAAPAARVDAPAVAPPPRTPTTISALGAAAGWSGVLAGLAVDVVIPRRGWSVFAELEGGAMVTGDLHLEGAIARAGVVARLAALELRAGATVAPILTTDGAGDRTVLVGAGTSARLRVPLDTSLRAVIAAGVDAFATRTAYLRAGMPTVTTPWLAPWLAVGVEASL